MPEATKAKAKRAPQECPYCRKQFGNVKNHILMAHQTESQESPAELTREDLLTKPPRKEPETIKYHCNDCQGILRKGEEFCSKCHQRLVWDGVE